MLCCALQNCRLTLCGPPKATNHTDKRNTCAHINKKETGKLHIYGAVSPKCLSLPSFSLMSLNPSPNAVEIALQSFQSCFMFFNLLNDIIDALILHRHRCIPVPCCSDARRLPSPSM